MRVFRRRWQGCAFCLCRRIERLPLRWFEMPLAMAFWRSYQCRHCQQRFWRFL
jgi:hypothetical protein